MRTIEGLRISWLINDRDYFLALGKEKRSLTKTDRKAMP